MFIVNFWPKLTLVHPKIVSWCSNWESRSICADTVDWLDKLLNLPQDQKGGAIFLIKNKCFLLLLKYQLCNFLKAVSSNSCKSVYGLKDQFLIWENWPRVHMKEVVESFHLSLKNNELPLSTKSQDSLRTKIIGRTSRIDPLYIPK